MFILNHMIIETLIMIENNLRYGRAIYLLREDATNNFLGGVGTPLSLGQLYAQTKSKQNKQKCFQANKVFNLKHK